MDGLCVGDEGDNWWLTDVRPSDPFDAGVFPATPSVPAAASSVVATPSPQPRMLYLVVISLPPNKCMPYSAGGNRKKRRLS